MQIFRRADALNRRDNGTIASDGQSGAALDRAAIDMNNARAALAGVAADMRAGQVKMLAQELGEKSPRINGCGNFLAVNDHRDARHEPSSTGCRVSLPVMPIARPIKTPKFTLPIDRKPNCPHL